MIDGLPEMNVVPNEETFTLLMTAYANIGDVLGTDNALRILESNGFVPNANTMNIILNSFINVKEEFDMQTFLSCYSEYFGEGENKFLPNSETYTQLLLAAERNSSAEDSLTWYDGLIASGLKITRKQKLIVSNTISPGIFHNYYGTEKLKKFKDENNSAFETENKISKIDRKYGPGTLNYYALEGDVMNVKRILAERRDLKIEFDISMINALILSYCKAGDLINARNILDKMIDKNKISIESNTDVIENVNENVTGNINEEKIKSEKKKKNAVKLIDTYNFEPNLTTMRILIHTAASQGDIRSVEEIYQDMIRRGFETG